MTDATYTQVARLSDIPPDDKLAVDAGGRSLLLCRYDGRIFAIENRCSHLEEPLICGKVRAGFIACPVHGSRFDLQTGEALNPPATDAILTFPVRIAGDAIEVAL